MPKGVFSPFRSQRTLNIVWAGCLVLLFAAVFLLHYKSPCYTAWDYRYTIPTAQSMMLEGNFDLDEYEYMFDKGRDYRVHLINGHYYNRYPISLTIIAFPLVYMAHHMGAVTMGSPTQQEKLLAAICALVACIFFYLAIRSRFGRIGGALTMLIFSFCTPVWSVVSRGLFQHSPSIALLSIALYLFLLAERKPVFIMLVGVPLALAYTCRPTNSIPVAVLSIYVFFNYRSFFLPYVLLMLLTLVPFFCLNLAVYDALLSPYFNPSWIEHSSNYLISFLGILLSPSRGLFIYCPFVAFCVAGAVLALRYDHNRAFIVTLSCIIVLHTIGVAMHATWWLGHTYGPRTFTDMMPFICFFLPYALLFFWRCRQRWIKSIALTFFALCIIWSTVLHMRGACSMSVYYWNEYPSKVDHNPDRVWDWRDPQFLRGIFPSMKDCDPKGLP